MSKLIYGAILLFLAISVCSAQQPSTVTGATVTASVSTLGDIFTYSYRVTNSPSSKAPIWSMDIDISRTAGAANLDGHGLKTDSAAELLAKAVNRDSRTVPSVPVGVLSPPGWTGGPSVGGTASWAADDDPFLVNPGQVLA